MTDRKPSTTQPRVDAQQLTKELEQGRDADRRARPRGGRRPLDVIRYLYENDTGTPLSIDQLARAIGVSTTTIRADIRYNVLIAFKAGGRDDARKEWRVLFIEAKRYLRQMGVFDAYERSVRASRRTRQN